MSLQNTPFPTSLAENLKQKYWRKRCSHFGMSIRFWEESGKNKKGKAIHFLRRTAVCNRLASLRTYSCFNDQGCVVPRYQTMKGDSSARWGWDCHGLPIEEIVERKLGISGKKQIEEVGIKSLMNLPEHGVAIRRRVGRDSTSYRRWLSQGFIQDHDSDYMNPCGGPSKVFTIKNWSTRVRKVCFIVRVVRRQFELRVQWIIVIRCYGRNGHCKISLEGRAEVWRRK